MKETKGKVHTKRVRVNVRRQGNNFERDVVRFFANLLQITPYNGKNVNDAQVGRSSHFSKALDDMGIDIWFKDSYLAGLFKVQCKKSKKKDIDISSIEDHPDRLLFTKLTSQKEGNSRESHRATMVTMDIALFEEIMSVYLTKTSNHDKP